MILATFNGLDLLLIVLVIVFAFIAWMCFQDFDRWAHYEDPFTRTIREIDELPETPELFDQEIA